MFSSEYIPRRTIEALFNHQLDTYQVGSIIQLDNHFGCVLSISGEKMIILVCNHSEKFKYR